MTIRPDAPLFDALALMIRHKIHRLVVAEGEHMVGFLQQLDLLSYLSNHSYLITLQILEAPDIPTLKIASEQITQLIGVLQQGGTKVGMIARLVQEINATLFERAWRLIAPADLVGNSCLFVMGSEGRGEQLLKTDQDNGLILRNGYDCPHDLEAICGQFSAALSEFGYPPCPGHIMVSNPAWRHPEDEFARVVREWLITPTSDNLMALAIFMDAHSVCGDSTLLASVRSQIWTFANDNVGLLNRFASAIDAFSQGTGWWNRLRHLGSDNEEQLDLKKAGIFPLVHGVRSLAFEYQLAETNTVERINALVAAERLPPDLGTDLTESLYFFMGLRLQGGLDALKQGRAASSDVALERLSSLDRDLLKDTLAVVKHFKAMLHHHFHLDVM